MSRHRCACGEIFTPTTSVQTRCRACLLTSENERLRAELANAQRQLSGMQKVVSPDLKAVRLELAHLEAAFRDREAHWQRWIVGFLEPRFAGLKTVNVNELLVALVGRKDPAA